MGEANAATTRFYSGDYVGACEEARGAALTAETRSAWFRALVQLGRSEEAEETLAAGPGALDYALRLYARAHTIKEEPRADWTPLLEQIDEITGLEGDRDESAYLLATVCSWAGQNEQAYHLASQSAAMEAQLLLVTILARIGRFDLVEKRMEKLRRFFGDQVAYQLVEAQMSLEKGGAAMRDAVYIYQELVETRGRTPKLLNSLAAALLLTGRHSEAEPLILEVLQLNPHDAQALSLLINFSIAKGAGVHLINDQLAYTEAIVPGRADLLTTHPHSRLAAANRDAPFLKLLEGYAGRIEALSRLLQA